MRPSPSSAPGRICRRRPGIIFRSSIDCSAINSKDSLAIISQVLIQPREAGHRVHEGCIQSAQHLLELIVGRTEHNKAFSFHQRPDCMGKFVLKAPQVRNRCLRVGITFVKENLPAIFAQEPLVNENSVFEPCRFNHLAGQSAKRVQSCRLDRKFNLP